MGVEKVDLDTLLARADFITLHTPLTDQTRNILSKENLAKTKKGVRIVNCARGGLADERALRALLNSGHVAGAGFDVFGHEPATGSPLFGHPNAVCTPHLGAAQTAHLMAMCQGPALDQNIATLFHLATQRQAVA